MHTNIHIHTHKSNKKIPYFGGKISFSEYLPDDMTIEIPF